MTPSEHDHDHDHNHHGESGDATCPVCEMTVDSATSPSRAHLGKKYYFCNESCARAFDQEPDEYAHA